MITVTHLLAVGIGAALGAVCRWLLGLWLNHAGAFVPWGTLAANYIGAYVIGVAIALVLQMPSVPEWLRLFLVTGFLGGLTTFSTFSAETFGLLQRGDLWQAFSYIFISVLGALALTALGVHTGQRLF